MNDDHITSGSSYTGADDDDRMLAANGTGSTAGGTRGDVGMSVASGTSDDGTPGVPTRGAPAHSGIPAEMHDTAFEHSGREYALVPSGHEEWQIRHPDGRTVGLLAVISHAGEESEAVFVTRRVGSDDAVAEGTDWRGIVAAVINDEAADQRDPVQLDPTVEHVRGGLIGRGPADVDGLS
ncbi:hypothetical protein [Rathayibacter sp. VKM Ac-2754]|uniref:hypothetical protein n=1 Tax=Rathayibacter sp. VKM Ac-2754 TaxID=2609251 RepID=UPI001359E8B3|nr:hypothetical protein [Rathayibacter sp. VKM Ac-2754]MWV59786.1 hypothetical protein [Rathayibacter sp. VKM Ac-2754]